MSTTPTQRDYIHDSLRRTDLSGGFRVDDIYDNIRDEASVNRRTVSFCLWAWADLGYLAHDEGSETWYPADPQVEAT